MVSLKNNDEKGYTISITSLNGTGVTFLIIGLSVNNQLWRSL